MTKESGFLQKILGYIQAGDFKNATSTITGIDNEDDERHDIVLGCIVNLFNRDTTSEEKTLEILKQVVSIYNRTKEDTSELEKELNNVLSQFGVLEGAPVVDQDIGNLSAWTDNQLENRIEKLKKEQQDLLKAGGDLNPQIGEQLNELLTEQNRRTGSEIKKIATDEEDSETQESKERPEGADFWFVVPSAEELKKKIKIHIVCGSPIIEVLRAKYKIEYKVKEILNPTPNEMENLSGEEEYEINRELDRQRSFLANYLDPTLVLDQNICAYEMASEFQTDKYKKPILVRINDNVAYYIFKSGSLRKSISAKTSQYTFTVEGNVIGRFAICLNRKEPSSGRFINDEYDILEFQDGQPCLYFYSSKGVSALSNALLKEIKMMVRHSNFDLSIPTPTEVREEMSEEELKEFTAEYKDNAIKNEESHDDESETAELNAPKEKSEESNAVDEAEQKTTPEANTSTMIDAATEKEIEINKDEEEEPEALKVEKEESEAEKVEAKKEKTIADKIEDEAGMKDADLDETDEGEDEVASEKTTNEDATKEDIKENEDTEENGVKTQKKQGKKKVSSKRNDIDKKESKKKNKKTSNKKSTQDAVNAEDNLILKQRAEKIKKAIKKDKKKSTQKELKEIKEEDEK